MPSPRLVTRCSRSCKPRRCLFLRLVQGLFNGIVVAALLLVLARYIVSASSGGLVFSTPVRVHLAVLGGLFLLSVAFGYQLDKLELVYSNRGIATGVSFTDQNAQFAALDLLTAISGIAAALLVGGAFTRMLWPLGLTIAVWFVASLVIGRLYPEARLNRRRRDGRGARPVRSRAAGTRRAGAAGSRRHRR